MSAAAEVSQVAQMCYGTDAERCRCRCHQNPAIKHLVQCCIRCDYCGERIRCCFYIEHREICAQRAGSHVARPPALWGES